jgi:hypothetical protein
MKQFHILALLASLLLTTACHEVREYEPDPRGTFEQLWTILDTRYCFFAEKGIDWNDVHDRYSEKISNEMTAEQLFNVCADMLGELRDGHTNLSSTFNTSYYRKWWSDYPQNYSARLIEEHYFNFNYLVASGLTYGMLSPNIGYIRYASFSQPIGEGNLDQVLAYLASADGLVIDIRDNGGGDMTNVEILVSRFIDSPTLVGYISHKTGPGHDEFSEPRPYTYKPAAPGRMHWTKPVAVLTNRSTFSAANNFASIMKLLPGVMIVGATTGGGSGMPYSSELTNGWTIRFSACSVLDAERNTTEFGVEPTEGCAVDLDPQAALEGRDTMLDRAIELLKMK